MANRRVAEKTLELLLKDRLDSQESDELRQSVAKMRFGGGDIDKAFGHKNMGEDAKIELLKYYLGIENEFPPRLRQQVKFLRDAEIDCYVSRNDVTMGCRQIIGDRYDPETGMRGVGETREQKAFTLLGKDREGEFLVVIYVRADQKLNVDGAKEQLLKAFPHTHFIERDVNVEDLARYGLEPGCITPVSSACAARSGDSSRRILQVIDPESHITGWTPNSLSATMAYSVKGEQLRVHMEQHAACVTIGGKETSSWRELPGIILGKMPAEDIVPERIERLGTRRTEERKVV